MKIILNRKIFRQNFKFLIGLIKTANDRISQNEQQIIEVLKSIGYKEDKKYQSRDTEFRMIFKVGYDLQFNPIYAVNKDEIKKWIKMWGGY